MTSGQTEASKLLIEATETTATRAVFIAPAALFLGQL